MNIIDPTTNQQYTLNSVYGRKILKQYIKHYQKGGHFIEVSDVMLSNTQSFGPDSCAANAFHWMGYGVFTKLFNALKIAGQKSTLKNRDDALLSSSSLQFLVHLIEEAIRKTDKQISNFLLNTRFEELRK